MGLPLFFGLLASVGLLAALGYLWRSIRLGLGAEGTAQFRTQTTRLERARLLDEKRALLQGLRELSEDLEAGKISQDDFDKVEKNLKRRAVRVIQALEADIAEFRGAALAAVAAHAALSTDSAGDQTSEDTPADESEEAP